MVQPATDTPKKPRSSERVGHKPGCVCTACERKQKAIAQSTREGWKDPTIVAPQTFQLEKLATMESMGLGTLAENADNPGEVYDADFPVLYALPSPNSARSRILQYITYRAEGLDGKAIAERMGMKYATLRTMVYKASKEGWLKFTDPTERFQNQIVPKVVDNIEHWIDKKDKTMTIEAAKGSGIFKNYQAIKVEGQAPMTVLALKIEPAPGGNAKVLTGHVVGVPKAIEGELKE